MWHLLNERWIALIFLSALIHDDRQQKGGVGEALLSVYKQLMGF